VKIKIIILDGNTLSCDSIRTIVENPHIQISLDAKALSLAEESFKFVHNNLTKKIIYGINTGFGPMATHLIGKGQLKELQYNLIRSHAVGMGNPIPQDFVLAAMIVRLNTLVKGYSGVSLDLLQHLSLLINERIIPFVPEHGAVGTSGDLVQLAHIALTIIGEGKAWHNGSLIETKAIYEKLNIRPYELKPKEGLSLINGTSVMTGISALLIKQADHLLQLAVSLAALSLEAVEAYSDSISERLHAVRPHAGQKEIALQLRNILTSSHLLKDRVLHTGKMSLGEDTQEMPEAIQEVYSLRCIPQILGPIYDIVEKAKNDIRIELNSATDNPIVDFESKTFLHGGNFHGDYIAAAIDQVKIGMVKMTMLSERRTNYFMHHKINKRFPPFMNLEKPGLTLGLQALQFVATSTTAQSQSLAFPHHIHSIPTNGDNQDVVSMGTDASLIAAKVLENAYIVQTIELITLCQAVDFLGIQEKLSTNSQNLYNSLRSLMPKISKDRVLVDELQTTLQAVKNRMGFNIPE